VSLLAIGLFAPLRTHAQPVPVPYSYAAATGPDRSERNGAIFCGSGFGNPQMGEGTISEACTSAAGLPGASYTMFRSVGAGQIGAAVSLTAQGVGGSGAYLGWQNSATSRWADRLSFMGDERPSTVELTVSWDGRLAGDVSFTGYSPFGAGASATAAWGFGTTSPNGEVLKYFTSEDVSFASFNPRFQVAKNVSDIQTFSLPVGAAGFVDFFYLLQTSASIAGTFYSSASGYIYASGALSADFANTGKLVGLVARDASGNDITAQTQYTFANGTQVAAATVPEPGTWVLLGTGLLALGGMARRRRRRVE
jgi:hypothetical protein